MRDPREPIYRTYSIDVAGAITAKKIVDEGRSTGAFCVALVRARQALMP
jgi:hypothetical protein